MKKNVMKSNDCVKTCMGELFQLLAIGLYLCLAYIQEVKLLHYFGVGSEPQERSIHSFLSAMQLNFLPEYFYLLFIPLFFVSISLIMLKKWRWYFLALSCFLISAILIADRMYYSFFSSVITTESFSAAYQLNAIRSAIYELITFKDVLVLSVPLMFISFGYFYNKFFCTSLKENRLAFCLDKLLGICIFLIALYCYNIAFFIPKRYVTISDTNSQHRMIVSETPVKSDFKFIPAYKSSAVAYARTFGVLNFHVNDLTKVFNQNAESRQLQKKITLPEDFKKYFIEKHQLNEIKSPFYGVAKNRNVFLIHFESLHPSLINANISGEEVTPTLNRLANGNFLWSHILDQATVGGSSDSEFSALTGTMPSTKQISTFNSKVLSLLPALPISLQELGYKTISLHGYDIAFWNRNINHPLLGFEEMYFKPYFTEGQTIGLGISDNDFFSHSVDLLQQYRNSKFFAYLITLSSHYPYHGAPKGFSDLFKTAGPSDSLVVKYLQLIHYTDDAINNFLNKIKRIGLWENSIFIIYGDHRPGVDEKMVNSLENLTGKNIMSQRFSCVPILLVIPGKEHMIDKYKRKYSDIVGGLYDIFPTIMHLIGEESPMGVTGTHLFVPNEKRMPMPVLKTKNSGFVYNGILYEENGKTVVKDKFGYVFVNDPNAVVENDTERNRLFWKAWIPINYHNYIHTTLPDLTSILDSASE